MRYRYSVSVSILGPGAPPVIRSRKGIKYRVNKSTRSRQRVVRKLKSENFPSSPGKYARARWDYFMGNSLQPSWYICSVVKESQRKEGEGARLGSKLRCNECWFSHKQGLPPERERGNGILVSQPYKSSSLMLLSRHTLEVLASPRLAIGATQ